MSDLLDESDGKRIPCGNPQGMRANSNVLCPDDSKSLGRGLPGAFY